MYVWIGVFFQIYLKMWYFVKIKFCWMIFCYKWPSNHIETVWWGNVACPRPSLCMAEKIQKRRKPKIVISNMNVGIWYKKSWISFSPGEVRLLHNIMHCESILYQVIYDSIVFARTTVVMIVKPWNLKGGSTNHLFKNMRRTLGKRYSCCK